MLLSDRERQVRLFNDLTTSIIHHSLINTIWAIEQGAKIRNEEDRVFISKLIKKSFSAPKDLEEKTLICRLLHIEEATNIH